MFPKNAWYVACTPDEIDDKPLGRRICGESIVLYRGPDGKAAALEDFCPHRGAPLSLGSVTEGKLVCGYHGLEMGCDGKAIAMPGQRSSSVTGLCGYGRGIRRGRIPPGCTTSVGPKTPSGHTAAGSFTSVATIG